MMPLAFSASRASPTRPAERAATPMACGSMPVLSQERICSASTASSSARVPAIRSFGRWPRMGDR
jgi:hypothetical protein